MDITETKEYKKAKELFYKGEVQKALKILLKINCDETDAAELYFFIGECYCHLQEFEKYIEYLDKAISATSEKDVYLEYKANFLFINKQYEEAISCYLMIKNKDYRTYGSIGYLYQVLNNFEEAERYYTIGVDSATDDYEKQGALIAKAEFYCGENKQFKKAIECYNQILDLPECHNKEETYESIANVYSAMEDYNKAAEYMYKSIEVLPYTRNIAKTGEFCYLAKRYNEAIELYKRVFEINDIEDDDELNVYYNNIADCYKNTEQYDLAIEYYNKSLKLWEKELKSSKKELSPQDEEYVRKMHESVINMVQNQVIDTKLNIADCYYKQKNYSKAMEYLDKTLEKFPKNEKVIFIKAGMLEEQKCYNAAIEMYKSLSFQEPFYQAVNYNCIAVCYSKMSDYDSALEYCNKALDLYKTPRILLNKAYYTTNSDDAILIAQQVFDLNPEPKEAIDAYLHIGIRYSEKGEYNNAIKYFDKVIELDSKNPETYYAKGCCYSKTERFEEAIPMYEKAIDNGFDNYVDVSTWLGFCYFCTQKFDQALEYFDSVINYIIKNCDLSGISINNYYKNLLGQAYFFKGRCLIELNELKDDIIISFFKAKEYGYNEDECNEIIKKIKNE